jgi:hypothetical protein
MPTAGVTHHITLADPDGTTNKIGFMRYLGSQGGSLYSVQDAEAISPSIVTAADTLRDATNLGQYSIAYQQKWTQYDFTGGIGGMLARLHPTQLAVTGDGDIDPSGRLIAAQRRTETTVDTGAAQQYATGFAVVGTQVWAFVGSDVYRWNYTDTDWDIGTAPDASSSATTDYWRNGVEFNGDTFAPSWKQSDDTPVRYIHKADADDHWTRIDSGGSDTNINSPKYMAVADGKLWGGYWLTDTHHVKSSIDPTSSANWSSAVAVGDSSSEITGLVSDGVSLLVCKTDGIWTLFPDGSTRNMTPEYETMRHPHHFRNPLTWNRHILLPLGWGGMIDLFEGRYYDISHKYSAPSEAAMHGQVVATAADAEFVYLMVLSAIGNAESIIKGKFMGFKDDRPVWQWFKLGRNNLSAKTSPYTTNMFAEGVPSGANIHRRIWIGTGKMEAGYPTFIPEAEDVETAYDTSSNGAGFETTVFDASAPGITKIFESVEVKTLNVSGSDTINVLYRLDRQAEQGGSYISLGTIASENGSISFPAGITGKLIQLLFQWTSDANAPQALAEFSLNYYLRPLQKETFPVSLLVAAQQRLLNGATGGSPKRELAQLRTWSNQADRVALVDEEENSQNVMFLPGTLKITKLHNEPKRRSEYLVKALLAEV